MLRKRKCFSIQCAQKTVIWLLFVGVILISFSGLIIIYIQGPDVRSCYMEPVEKLMPASNETHVRLADVLQAAVQPRPSRSIFFLETSCRHLTLRDKPTDNTVQLTARQACAIESAALHNQKSDIFVLFVSAKYFNNLESQPLLEAILSYKNVHLRNLNLWTFAAGTSVFDCFGRGTLFRSHYLSLYVSDFLRFLTLFRFGGTYLDMDTITLRSMESIPPNYCGAQSAGLLNAAVMNFASDGVGHHIADLCSRIACQNFGKTPRPKSGPGIITHVAKLLCGTSNITKMFMNRAYCFDLLVFPPDAFYAVPRSHWSHFFEMKHFEETLARTRDSYLTHVWNKPSYKAKFKSGAYGELAKQNCPRVYGASNDYF